MGDEFYESICKRCGKTWGMQFRDPMTCEGFPTNKVAERRIKRQKVAMS